MANIPVVLPRQTDELLYSWLLRLSDANGFDFSRTFVNAYITPNASDSAKSKRNLKYDLLEDYEDVYKALEINIDKRKLFLSTGIFPYYKIFMTREQQAAIVDEAFDNNGKQNTVSVTHTKMISELRLCPECMREEQRRIGRFYYHRTHQLPGVTFCAKHGSPLLVYRGTQMHELDDLPKTENAISEGTNYGYAKYCRDLLIADIDCNANDLKEVILQRLYDEFNNDRHLLKQRIMKDFPIMGNSNKFNILWSNIHSQEYLDPITCTMLLMLLFPNPSELKTSIAEKKCPAVFKNAIKEHHCKLKGSYSSTLVELQHDCGCVFCITPNEFMSGWECPQCEITPKKLNQNNNESSTREWDERSFLHEVYALTGKEYTVIGTFKNLNESIEIRHNKCGHVQKYKPIGFIDGGRCKYCNQMLRENQFINMVDSLSKGQYKILAKRSNNLYTIMNVKTGFAQDLTGKKILGELRRPTPSALLPKEESGKDIDVKTQINDIRAWIVENCPKGEPIFLEDIIIAGIDYQVIKNRLRDLYIKKHVIKPVSPGIYEYSDDNLSADDIVKARYLVRNGTHIGYPSGSNALYYLGILKEKPDEYRVVTNKETSSNATGRTTKFLGHKLRIRGSEVEINDSNWQVLMLLDTVVNIKKYLKGADTTDAYKIIAEYVNKNKIRPEGFSKYQDKYAFAYNAVRNLFKEEYAKTNISSIEN